MLEPYVLAKEVVIFLKSFCFLLYEEKLILIVKSALKGFVLIIILLAV